MPYAVVRRPSWLLPFAVVLDDLVSMSPDRPMSQAETIEIFVRLSATGTAEVPGDWRWLSSQFPWSSRVTQTMRRDAKSQRDTDPAKLRASVMAIGSQKCDVR